jgi:4-hydroxy-2-oxoheptanedioate aldolase
LNQKPQPLGIPKSDSARSNQALAACQCNGIVPGIQCGSGKAARSFAAKGFRFVTFASDRALLPAAVEKEIAAARGGD